MGKKNTITKDYMSVPEYFADSFNYYLFDGRQIIKPSNLQVLDPTEIAIIPEDASEETVEKIRDLLKQCVLMEDERATYLLLGIENQSDIHYALPVKNMNYDAINYGKQVSDIAKEHRKKKDIKDGGEFLSGFTKEDKLKPIITLTIYFGAEDWDAPRSLKEMFEEIDESIMDFVEDYKVHLIVPNEIKDFDKFKTDFGKVMKYIAFSKDKKALSQLQHDEAFRSVGVETVRLINECTNSNIVIKDGEEDVDMCEGLKGMLEDARLERERDLIQKALDNGRTIEEISEFMGIPLEQIIADITEC
ncbi:MAG: Rpn family recombination-promoting nuclease/putative transposase [Tyzzerella sp.]|nr:Rpn family recombination-promoting nuclease/putative transposase [Tyzzerella sp.]